VHSSRIKILAISMAFTFSFVLLVIHSLATLFELRIFPHFLFETSMFGSFYFAVWTIVGALYWKLGKSMLIIPCILLSMMAFVHFMQWRIHFWISCYWLRPDSMHTWLLPYTLCESLILSFVSIISIWIFYWVVSKNR